QAGGRRTGRAEGQHPLGQARAQDRTQQGCAEFRAARWRWRGGLDPSLTRRFAPSPAGASRPCPLPRWGEGILFELAAAYPLRSSRVTTLRQAQGEDFCARASAGLAFLGKRKRAWKSLPLAERSEGG